MENAQTAGDSGRSEKKRGVLSAKKRIAFALVALSLSTLMMLVVAEIGLRIAGWPLVGLMTMDGDGPLEPQESGPDGSGYREFEGEYRQTHWDYTVVCRINADGFRERDPEPKMPGEWRIGLIGDSFTWGVGVEQHERFGDLWLQAIKKRAPHLRLYNFGVPGSGTIHSAEMLAAVGEKYELDEIIFACYANDMQDDTKWFRRADAAGTSSPQPQRESRSPLRLWLRGHTRLPGFIWINGLRAIMGAKGMAIDTETDTEEKFVYTERALSRLKEVVGQRPLTIWYIPAHMEWDDEVWASCQQSFALKDEDRRPFKRRLQHWADDNGVVFVDMAKFLAGQIAAEVTYPRDPHWNAKGHELVAKGLAASQRSAHVLRHVQTDEYLIGERDGSRTNRRR